MKLNVICRIGLGLMAVAPIIAVGFVVSAFLSLWPPSLPVGKIAIGAMLVGIVFYATAVGCFLYMVQTSDVLDSPGKARWTLLLVMWFPFAALSFWYQFVWRRRPIV